MSTPDHLAGPYGIALFKWQSDGQYQLTYSARGLLTYFKAEVVESELALRSGVPGGDSPETHSYHFVRDGDDFRLLSARIEALYTGQEWPVPKDSEYEVTIDYTSGSVTDSRGIYRPDISVAHGVVMLSTFTFEPAGL